MTDKQHLEHIVKTNGRCELLDCAQCTKIFGFWLCNQAKKKSETGHNYKAAKVSEAKFMLENNTFKENK